MRGIQLLLFLIFLTPSAVTAKNCGKGWNFCGDSLCCCKKHIAMCKDMALKFIPKLPDNITSLAFDGNDIKTLSAETFKNISNLKIEYLGLGGNGIKNLHNDSFANLKFLRILNLRNNIGINVQQLSMSLYGLQYNFHHLYLDNTGLQHLPDNFFGGLIKTKIQHIGLRKNRIKVLNEIWFYPLRYLKSLDFSNNWISNIPLSANGSRLGHKNLESLKLNSNEIDYWPPWFCHRNTSKESLYPKLENLDLEGNTIIILVRKAWSCLKTLKRLNLARNAIQILRADTFLDLISLEKLVFSSMAKPFRKVHPKAFHNLNLKDLHLDHNNLVYKPDTDVSYGKLFIYTPNIRKLYIGYNNFRKMPHYELEAMLSPLKNLTDLSLEGAHIYRVPENLFNQLKQLTKLYMGHNRIQKINPASFMNVTSLQTLYLEYNWITVIDDTFPVTLRHSLKGINLAGNPFSCSFCAHSNNSWFRNWIDTSKIHFFRWPDHYKCAFPPNVRGTLLQSHKPTKKDCEPKDPLIIAYITIAVFLVLISLIGIVGYKARWYLRFWTIKCRRKCSRGVKPDSERQKLLGDDVTYDAYVIYHDNDRAFIRREILRFLEEEHHYKLFIWDRDFTAGDQTVGIVVDNIYNSNHVIAVISKSFLKDQWCDFQLAVATDRQIELKRKFLTLLTLEDVDKQLLSKSWCVLFTKTPTAEWCERKNDIKRKLFENQILSSVPCRFRQ